MRTARADDRATLTAAAAVLDGGGLVVVPTDTVYGLAARPSEPDAVEAVYRAKGRPQGMQLPALAADPGRGRVRGGAPGREAGGVPPRWCPGPPPLSSPCARQGRRPDWLAG